MNRLRRRTVDLNSRAIAHLKGCQHDEAVQLLSKGLNVFLRDSENKANRRPPSSERTRPWQDGGERSCLVHSISIDSAADEEGGASYLDNMLPFFNRAFTVAVNAFEKAGSNSIEVPRSETTAILLYNIGLSYHHKGLTTGVSSSLKRALDFYEFAYDTLEAESRCGRGCSDLSRLVLLAIATNMGHAYAYFYDVEETRSCRSIVAEIFASISPDSPVLSEDDYFFFYLSMIVYHDIDFCTAPAA